MPNVCITSPHKDETLVVGKPHEVRWAEVQSSMFVSLFLVDKHTNSVVKTLVRDIKNERSYSWVPSFTGAFQVYLEASAKTKGRHRRQHNEIYGYSDYFSVISPNEVGLDECLLSTLPFGIVGIIKHYHLAKEIPGLEITFPVVGMANWVVGSTLAIRWHGGDPSWGVGISLVDPLRWEVVATLAENLPNSGSFPCTLSTLGKFRICVEALLEDGCTRDWSFSCDFEVALPHENLAQFKDSPESLLEYYDRGGEEKAVTLLDVIFSDQLYFNVDYRQGGAYNSIVNVEVNDSTGFIIRMPKQSMDPVQFTNVSSLSLFLSSKLPHVPILIAADHTSDNALGRQYWLQTRLAGQSLSHAFPTFNQAQRCFLAGEVASYLAKIFRVRKKGCGSLVAASPFVRRDRGCIGRPQFARWEDPRLQSFGPGAYMYSKFDLDYKAPTNLHEYLQTRFEEMAKCRGDTFFLNLWKLALLYLPKEKSSKLNCLTHTDFYKRNILIDERDGMPYISGVVDWDDCEILPMELAYTQVPGWLWDEPEAFSRREVLGYDIDEPLTDPNYLEIRATFLAKMEVELPGYCQVVREIRTKQPTLILLGMAARLGEEFAGVRCRVALARLRDLLREHGLDDKKPKENFNYIPLQPSSPERERRERYEQDKIRQSVQNVLKQRTQEVIASRRARKRALLEKFH